MIYTLILMVTTGGFLQEHETTKYRTKEQCEQYLYRLETATERLKLKHVQVEMECRPSKPVPMS